MPSSLKLDTFSGRPIQQLLIPSRFSFNLGGISRHMVPKMPSIGCSSLFPSTLQRLLLWFDCYHPEIALELDCLAVV